MVTSGTKAGIKREPLSDHDFISLQIGQVTIQKGPGDWRIDNSLLTNPKFSQMILDVIYEVEDETDFTDPCAKWDWLKYRIRKSAIQFSKLLYQKERGHEISLQRRFVKISEQIDQDDRPTESDHLELTSLKREITEIEMARANRTIAAARTNWALRGERPTRYFLNLQKIQTRNKAITELVNEEGQTLTDNADILAEEQKFYQNLYYQGEPEEDLSELEQLGLSRESVPTLTDTERAESWRSLIPLRNS